MSGSPWGGSEELWGRTALKLVERGLQITASVEAHSPAHARLREMATHGINVWQRPPWYSRKKKPLSWFLGRDPAKHEVLELIKRLAPSLVVFSSGTTIIPVEFLELCIASKIGFVTISQANYEDWWPPDWVAERLGPAMKAALRCYFVSEGNLRLAERQLGVDLPNAEVVRNPVNLPPGPPPP